MVRHGAPVSAVLHAMNDGAVTSGTLTKTSAVGVRGQCWKFVIDVRKQFMQQIVTVGADGRRIDVLVASVGGEAVRKHDDDRTHLVFVDQTGGAFGNIFSEIFPVGMRHATAGETDQVIEYRVAFFATLLRRGVTVPGRKPDMQLTYMRIAQWIACQYLRRVFQFDDVTLGPRRPFYRHIGFLTWAIAVAPYLSSTRIRTTSSSSVATSGKSVRGTTGNASVHRNAESSSAPDDACRRPMCAPASYFRRCRPPKWGCSIPPHRGYQEKR